MTSTETMSAEIILIALCYATLERALYQSMLNECMTCILVKQLFRDTFSYISIESDVVIPHLK